uniref:Uncharacterized protein n=1 Tax=Nelumbo nucifera TaxID=4432 RepID=A0A822YZL3_NELNU|nr:TPA_asm: hypothetical protein HUJ06_013857 [Nelumbo nucifera]
MVWATHTGPLTLTSQTLLHRIWISIFLVQSYKLINGCYALCLISVHQSFIAKSASIGSSST